MEFLKKHYEKILLSVVLAGLAVAAAWLPIKVAAVRRILEEATTGYTQLKPKPLPPLDMSTNVAAIKRAQTPPKATFGAPGHNVFNPIQWKKKADGTPIPITDTGLGALSLTNISPLSLRVEYLGIKEAGDIRYEFKITREHAPNLASQRPFTRALALGGKNEVFTLKDIKGPKEEPTEILLELAEFKTNVVVAKEKPVRQLAGYAADLRYAPENKSFLKQRAGQKLSFGDSTYYIVAISQSDVTLEDSQTKKRTTIRWNAAP